MTLSQLVGPLVLFALMIVVGLQLTPADFRRVLAVPRTIVGGTLAQLVFLPLMTWGLLSVAGLPPALGAGAVLLSAAPGAGLSNVMTAIAGGRVALSVTLTAVSSVLSVVTLPGLSALGMRLFLDDAGAIEVPVALIVGQLVLFLLVPITLGMWLRAFRPEATGRAITSANRIAVVFIIVLTAAGAVSGRANLPSGSEFAWTAATAFGWTLGAMAIGWTVATLLALDDDDRVTFVIEFAARNIALAVVIAVSSFQRLDLALFSGAYAMTGFPLVIGFSVLRGRRKGRRDTTVRPVGNPAAALEGRDG